MAKSKRLKALVFGAVAMTLSCSMLVGTTFAWFTDSVTSSNNVIKSGNLDVELEYWKNGKWNDVKGQSDILSNELWEPGVTEVAYFRIANAGSLALKYKFGVNIVSETTGTNVAGEQLKLSNYIYFDMDSSATEIEKYATRDDALSSVENPVKISEGYNEQSSLVAGAEKYLAMVVYMPETVGDEANHDGVNVPQIDLGINVVATQFTYEDDSFNNEYDKEAQYPVVTSATVPAGTTAPTRITAGDITVIVPQGAPAATYELGVDNYFEESDSVSYNINFYKDGEKVAGTVYDVEIQLEPMQAIEEVLHNGTPISPFNYNAFTGVLSFQTDSFSPFEIVYDEDFRAEGVEIPVGEEKITAGTFYGKNPAEFDESLADANSEYIALKMTINGETCYRVSARATTVVVSAGVWDGALPIESDSNYTIEVRNSQSGKLWSLISGLQNNAHSTVYLLPGTYNEATTINVYSSMDIIGVGNREDIKIVKVGCHSTTSKKPSNRHLFNCNGQKEDYIEVTLRNMQLDATEQNSYMGTFLGKEKQTFEDNAAVQSIRKSKVKCYDLDVIKGTNTSGFAFYVNGNNAVNGVKYTAYLYAENCTLDAANTGYIVSTKGTHKFYHTNLTYKNGASTYTNNSGSIKNLKMEWNDWEW